MNSLLQNILLDITLLEPGKALEFTNEGREVCSVALFEDEIEGETVRYYELMTAQETFHYGDSDIVAMTVYTEIRKKQVVLN